MSVVHVVDNEGNHHWGSAYGPLSEWLARGEVKEVDSASELPAHGDTDEPGTSEAGPGDPEHAAGPGGDGDESGVSRRKTRH